MRIINKLLVPELENKSKQFEISFEAVFQILIFKNLTTILLMSISSNIYTL